MPRGTNSKWWNYSKGYGRYGWRVGFGSWGLGGGLEEGGGWDLKGWEGGWEGWGFGFKGEERKRGREEGRVGGCEEGV